MKRIATSLAVIALAACIGGPTLSQKQTYLDRNPALDQRVKDAILRSEVMMGMTELDVVAAIGNPRDINRTTTAYGTSAQFVYETFSEYIRPKYTYVYFENGRVTSWEQ